MKTVFCAMLAIVVLLTSCSQKFSLQKRRYTKGFYYAGANRSKQNSKSIAGGSTIISRAEDESAETIVVKAEPTKFESAKEPLSPVPGQKQIRIINKSIEKDQQSFRHTSPSMSHQLSLTKNDGQNFSKSAGKRIDGLYVGVAIGGLLGLILFFLYLLATYTIAQALIIILIFLLITALVGGGAYVGFGF